MCLLACRGGKVGGSLSFSGLPHSDPPLVPSSEVFAPESVVYLNQLQDIWEDIGIPEDQSLQHTVTIKNHIQGQLDMLIKEEESQKEHLLRSINTCRKELAVLYEELQLPPFEENKDSTIL